MMGIQLGYEQATPREAGPDRPDVMRGLVDAVRFPRRGRVDQYSFEPAGRGGHRRFGLPGQGLSEFAVQENSVRRDLVICLFQGEKCSERQRGQIRLWGRLDVDGHLR